jgi:hypothetical protein
MDLLKGNFKEVKIVNIGGKDLTDGKTTLVLGVVWQLCKLYWIERCGEIPEAELVQWANSRVPPEFRIKSFKDKEIANCWFLLKLIASIDPKVVDEKVLLKCKLQFYSSGYPRSQERKHQVYDFSGKEARRGDYAALVAHQRIDL